MHPMSEQINWALTYQKFAPKLLGVCRRYIKDLDASEDILQEAFIVAMQKQNSYKGMGSVEGWLRKIIVNMSLNYLKSEMKKNSLTNYLTDTETQEEMIEQNHISRSQIYAVDFTADELLEAIDSLPIHHKAVFNMYVIDHFSHAKIGQILNISVGTSKSHLHRAKSKIQDILFEKAREKESKTKKMIAFFILIGLENRVFAHTFKSKFADYKIIPKKATIAAEQPTTPDLTTGEDKIYLRRIYQINQKVLACSWGLVFLLSGLYLWSQKNNLIFFKEINSEFTVKKAPDIIIKNKSINEPKEYTFSKTTLEKATESKSINNKTKKKSTTKKAIEYSLKSLDKKDSTDLKKAEELTVVKVYIKKQIIKKDTVYVYK